ncbi:nitrite reductase large subunit NirB [Persicobacter psychrovividus]|uniref:Nitrite reductase large subunit n=1 Tax=Persicobacter psychrovividus TaxID=387638 RepID=A0ABM7VI67_9BACT|nr:nitrite reductase large subunit [Persicobacter psychrovividus]
MKNLIIIGNGMVSYKFCEQLADAGGLSEFAVTIFGEEPRAAYDRVHLSEYFSHYDASKLAMAPDSFYADHGINLKLGTMVTKVDPETKTVTTSANEQYTYDELVFATGSSAFVPPIPGTEAKGVFVYRTIEDLEQITTYAKTCKSGAVIGGGLLGLEAAKAVRDLGLSAQVVEFAPRLMPRQLDQGASDILQTQIEQLGVEVLLSKATKQIVAEGDKVVRMDFADETSLQTDMVVISAGIRPRDELAKAAGITVHQRGGIVVNDQMETSLSGVYAIGECANYAECVFGLVAPGYDMAKVLVEKLMGRKKDFTFPDMSTKLKLIGVGVASFGDALLEAPEAQVMVYSDARQGLYQRLNISADGKKLLGGILVGDTEAYGMLLQTTQLGLKLPEDPRSLLWAGSSEGGNSGMSLMDLPDEAVICSCEAVTKGQLVTAVKEGTEDLASLKTCTKGGTGCGGCVPQIKEILDGTLASMGKEVKQVICEHFDYSRQEILDLIKVKKIKSFDELITAHGTGTGCEICKPLVASVLASTWNDMILKNNASLQDTNDRFLANIQKGGTYSVVPRIPAGEITPEKLIVIGEVAKKYSLYTKITGGQRIDLFGARMEDLPSIWSELIDAGFESGHAYAKSLRTVKSCVGKAWCRYGVQDSVAMAIRLEERYKGLRSPHKLKSGVSACIRECAEARGKDFGLIATEKGWNLYICGNGGITPKHAWLLASDLDDDTAIKYIDRFLMFYIRTAEPLTRTSKWFTDLEGGEAYVKDVVINDSLGICAELEAEMQSVVDSFQCEWKSVVEDENMRKQFAPFVNTDASDDTVEFVDVRGQKAPKPW